MNLAWRRLLLTITEINPEQIDIVKKNLISRIAFLFKRMAKRSETFQKDNDGGDAVCLQVEKK